MTSDTKDISVPIAPNINKPPDLIHVPISKTSRNSLPITLLTMATLLIRIAQLSPLNAI